MNRVGATRTGGLATSVAGAACVVISLAGCAPVDRWGIWESPADVETPLHRTPLNLTERVSAVTNEASDEAPLAIPDDGPLRLTVEDAVLLALQNNRDLRVERLNPVIVASFEQIERGVYDPEVFANAELFTSESAETSRATGEEFSTTRDETSVIAGVRQLLPTGTDIEATVSAERSISNRSPEQQVVRAGLSVTQALLRGFGPAVNLAAIRQAELDTVASLHQLHGFIEALLADTEIRYWRYALAAQRIRIFEESLALARRQQEEIEQRIEIGVLAQTQAASAQAEVAQREQDLIDARSDLEILRLQLLRLLNPHQGNVFEHSIEIETDPATEPAPIENLDERIELALRMRPDLNEAKLRLDQARLETVVTRNGILPRLDFFISLGKTGFGDTFSNTVQEIDSPTFDLTAGLEFSYPIGNRVAEGRDEGARASRRQASEAVSNLEQLIRLDVRLAAAEVERSREQISATTATRRLREEALRAEEERFRVGDSTSLLVAQSQRDLLESRINEVDALVAYRIALIELYLAEGALLSRRGLTASGPTARAITTH